MRRFQGKAEFPLPFFLFFGKANELIGTADAALLYVKIRFAGNMEEEET